MRANRMGVIGSLVLGTGIGLVALVPTGAARAAAAGNCVTGVVPVAFVLPDGSVHPAGEFTACPDRQLSPVQTLERLSAGGAMQGLFVAKQSNAEVDAKRPYLTFHRVENGEWILVGITLPPSGNGDHSRTLRLADPQRVAELAAQRTVGSLLVNGAAADESKVMLAARLR